MAAAEWIEEIKDEGLIAVAEALGLTVKRKTIAPCSACGADKRGSHDSRGPVGITPDGGGWRCHRCQARGDAITLAAIHFGEGAKPSIEGWRKVRAKCAALGLCKAEDDKREARSERPRVRIVKPEPAPARPPVAEVAALWAAGVPVTADVAVLAWLGIERDLDAAMIEERDLARALPSDVQLPAWAHCGERSWTESEHRLLLPLYGPSGALESLRARRVIEGADARKGLAPRGAAVVGLVLADATARVMLETGAAPQWWPTAQPFRIVIAEGEPDFLTWAAHWSDGAECPPAVIGVVSGSWTADIAARVPDHTRVIIRTHDDKDGEKYAEKILETLRGRCVVRRGGKDSGR